MNTRYRKFALLEFMLIICIIAVLSTLALAARADDLMTQKIPMFQPKPSHILPMVELAMGGQINFTSPPPSNPFNPSNPPTVSQDLQDLLGHAFGSNVLVELHGLYAPGLGKKYGGGLGAFYPINDYLYAGVRLDWVNGGFWMPSGNVGLQLPLHLGNYVTNIIGLWATNIVVTPFGYAGVAIPISGAVVGTITIGGSPPRDNNGQPTAILGWGASLLLYNAATWNIDLLFDQEDWTGFNGKQYRFGLAWHKRF